LPEAFLGPDYVAGTESMFAHAFSCSAALIFFKELALSLNSASSNFYWTALSGRTLPPAGLSLTCCNYSSRDNGFAGALFVGTGFSFAAYN